MALLYKRFLYYPEFRVANNLDAQLAVSSVREASCREYLTINAIFWHPSRHSFEHIALLPLHILAAGLAILFMPSFFFTYCVPRLCFAYLYRLFRTLPLPSVRSQGTPSRTLGTAFICYKLPGTMQSGVAAKGSDAAVMSVFCFVICL